MGSAGLAALITSLVVTLSANAGSSINLDAGSNFISDLMSLLTSCYSRSKSAHALLRSKISSPSNKLVAG
jgi:hypothetical protein